MIHGMFPRHEADEAEAGQETHVEGDALEGHEVVHVHAPLLEALPRSKVEVPRHFVHLQPPHEHPEAPYWHCSRIRTPEQRQELVARTSHITFMPAAGQDLLMEQASRFMLRSINENEEHSIFNALASGNTSTPSVGDTEFPGPLQVFHSGSWVLGPGSWVLGPGS